VRRQPGMGYCSLPGSCECSRMPCRTARPRVGRIVCSAAIAARVMQGTLPYRLGHGRQGATQRGGGDHRQVYTAKKESCRARTGARARHCGQPRGTQMSE